MITMATTTEPKPTHRLHGIDLARALALIGMVVTHTMELATADGTPLPASLLAGKASALFAVLAGFSITLSTRSYDTTRNAVLSLITRGGIIAFIGVLLGSVTTNIAVILVNYGIMFMLAPAVFRLPTRALAVLAPTWLAAAPVVGFAIRSGADLPKAWSMPHLGNITDLPYMATAIFSTGYFPVIEWFGYILVGLLLSRLNWHRMATAVHVLITGATTAVLAWVSSYVLLHSTSGMDVLVESSAGTHPKEWGGLLNALYVANAGSTPTDTWWWLAIVGPHSSTPFDLFFTAGLAAAVIALSMLTCTWLEERVRHLDPLLIMGSMSLTTYSFHVVFREFSSSFLIHAALMLALAYVYAHSVSRTGPLEKLVSQAVTSVAPKQALQSTARTSTVGAEANQ